MSSNASSNSDGSIHSLCSRGTLELVELKKNQSKRKPAASWTPEEETVFVDFLLSQFSASGDGNPKGATFTEAANLLKERFQNASGAEKTAGVCKNKWQSLKSAYSAVMDIKNTSGFTWSDEYGAGIVIKNDNVWDRYVKRHPAAKMMPKISKGSHVYRVPPVNDIPQATPLPFNLSQLTSATQEVMQASGSGLHTPGPSANFSNPSSTTVSTPSCFLASSAGGSAPSSVLMSVSCSAKHREQKDGSEMMKELTVLIKDFLQTPPQVTSAASSDPLAHAIVLLSQHKTFMEDDQLEIADYFARDKAQAIIFANFPETTQAAWLEKTLRKLKSNTIHDDDVVMSSLPMLINIVIPHLLCNSLPPLVRSSLFRCISWSITKFTQCNIMIDFKEVAIRFKVQVIRMIFLNKVVKDMLQDALLTLQNAKNVFNRIVKCSMTVVK
ncbi:hypothetical protein BD769DRAFT_1676650 [Suillus cothurnatus]|nr:hypothetical protein BD769DRAFT_1676650 [Suillus cothurnatus]